MNKQIPLWVLCIGFAGEVLAKPRPKLITVNIPFSINYAVGQAVESTVKVDPFPNRAGTVYNIKYEFSGVDTFRGTASYPETPNGAVVGRQSTSITMDVRTQNGDMMNWSDTWAEECISDEPGFPCSANTESADYSEEFALPAFEWNPAVLGKVEEFGGEIKIIVASSTSPVGYITSSGTFAGTLRITYTIDEKTAREYALEILELAKTNAPEGGMSQAREYYRLAINYRENLGATSYPGASVNENIREVEYLGRGYQGGKLQKDGFWRNAEFGDLNDFFNSEMPISYPAYNWLKKKGIIPPENDNPISAASDTNAPHSGWWLGFIGMSLDEAVDTYFRDPDITPPIVPMLAESLPSSKNAPETTPARRFPSVMVIDDRTALPLEIFVLSSNLTGVVQVPSDAPSDFLVVIRGDPAQRLKIEDKDGVSDVFALELEDSTISRSEGQSIPLPSAVDGAQVFAIRGATPDLGRVTMLFTFGTAATSVIGVIGLAAKPLPDLAAARGGERTRLRLSRTGNQVVVFITGPSTAVSRLQSSEYLQEWATIEEIAPFNGDAWVPIELSAVKSHAFFRVIE